MRRPCNGGGGFTRGVVELWQREVGNLRPRTFANLFGSSESIIMRLGMHKKLNKHRGCVNTVSFNMEGNVLVSGSDDRMVMLWDWNEGLVKLSFHSGHMNNVFQAKFMPYRDDRTLVTCAADGEVRLAHIHEGGEVSTKMLAQHEGRAHKMAIEPGSPYIFYSCGEDGVVQHFDLRTETATKLFTCEPFEDDNYRSIIYLNAITLDPRNPNLFAVAGADEYARVYDIRKYKWDGSGDFGRPINCFCPPHLIGDGQFGITGLAFSDQSELLVSYNDEHIYLFDKDNGLGPNPSEFSENCTVGGDEKEALSNKAAGRSEPQVYKGHRNCDTVKGVGFFGPRCEYVTSGSDCGNMFIWRKKDGELLRVMEGDEDVVNCIEPHPHCAVIASSGIDDDVKIWVPNAKDPAPPVNIDLLKKHRRRSKFRMLPLDIRAHIQSLRMHQALSGNAGPSSEWDLMDHITNIYYADDGSSENAEDGSGDCIVS